MGETVEIGQKQVLRLPPRLPELTKRYAAASANNRSQKTVFSSHDSGAARATWCSKLASGAQGYRCTSHVRWAHSAPTSRLNRAKNTPMLVLKISDGLKLVGPNSQRITTSKETAESSTEAIAELVGTVDAVALDLPRPPTCHIGYGSLDQTGRAPCLLLPRQQPT